MRYTEGHTRLCDSQASHIQPRTQAGGNNGQPQYPSAQPGAWNQAKRTRTFVCSPDCTRSAPSCMLVASSSGGIHMQHLSKSSDSSRTKRLNSYALVAGAIALAPAAHGGT